MNLNYFLFSSHLDDGEEILYVAHRHLFVYFKACYKVFFFGILLPLFLNYIIPEFFLGSMIWIFIGVIGMLYHFLDYFFDAWLITNNGVIDIERNGIFERNSTRVEFHMIEGIALKISGFWNTILNFGDVTLDKLGAKTSLILSDASNPRKLERILIKFQNKFVSEKNFKDHDALKGLLAEMISHHVRNNKK